MLGGRTAGTVNNELHHGRRSSLLTVTTPTSLRTMASAACFSARVWMAPRTVTMLAVTDLLRLDAATDGPFY